MLSTQPALWLNMKTSPIPSMIISFEKHFFFTIKSINFQKATQISTSNNIKKFPTADLFIPMRPQITQWATQTTTMDLLKKLSFGLIWLLCSCFFQTHFVLNTKIVWEIFKAGKVGEFRIFDCFNGRGIPRFIQLIIASQSSFLRNSILFIAFDHRTKLISFSLFQTS